MDRRDLLKMIAVVTGGAFIGGEALLTGCKTGPSIGGATFTPADISFLDEVSETIIPKTKTPGAKDAKVGQFMTVFVNDCYPDTDQKTFHEGIGKLDEASKKANGKSFMDATPQQRTDLLTSIDKEAMAYQKSKKKEDPTHYFTLLKQLTVFSYFTSKEGATEDLRYIAVPGKYDGDYPYKKGDKAWATT